MVADLKTGVGTSAEAKFGAFGHCCLFDDELASLGVDCENGDTGKVAKTRTRTEGRILYSDLGE